MATGAVAVSRRARPLRLDRILPRLALIAFIAGIGYLSVLPLARLQWLALEDRGQPYRDAYTRDGWSQTVRWTIELGVGSLVIAVVLGTGLAWAAHSLPGRLSLLRVLPIFPIILPPVAAVLGWAFLFSPVPGYGNQLLRKLHWWSGNFEGPISSYSIERPSCCPPRSIAGSDTWSMKMPEHARGWTP